MLIRLDKEVLYKLIFICRVGFRQPSQEGRLNRACIESWNSPVRGKWARLHLNTQESQSKELLAWNLGSRNVNGFNRIAHWIAFLLHTQRPRVRFLHSRSFFPKKISDKNCPDEKIFDVARLINSAAA